jgi:pimeloyl-ACP methyl ester carboxylesterase
MPLFGSGWKKNKAVAHTLPYDAAIMTGLQRGEPLPADRFAGVAVPTLVAAGAKSPEWVRNAAVQLAAALPDTQHHTLDGQRHYVKPDAIAPLLTDFFNEPARARPDAALRAGGTDGPAITQTSTPAT